MANNPFVVSGHSPRDHAAYNSAMASMQVIHADGLRAPIIQL